MSDIPKSGLARRKSLSIGGMALLLLVLLTALPAVLGFQTYAKFHEIGESWEYHTETSSQKSILMVALSHQMGVGGFVLNFRQYALGRDPELLETVRSQLDQSREIIEAYRSEATGPEEMQALDVIARTIANYESKLPAAMRAVREDSPTLRSDLLRSLDDREAVMALQTLERIWLANRQDSMNRIAQAVAQGQRLIAFGSVAVLLLVGGTLMLGVMVRELMRDMGQALLRLTTELAARRRLERSESRLAAAVEQSPATILIADTDGRIEYVNRRFEELNGWQRQEVPGQPLTILRAADTPPGTYTQIRKTLAEGQKWHGMLPIRRKDGSTYWTESTLLSLRSPDGETQNHIWIADDITDKRMAREQVARAQKLEAVGLMAGGLAHDFNNILTTIVGAAHLAAMDLPEDSEAAAEIGQIRIAARRAQVLVQQLLSFARRQPARLQPVDPIGLMSEVAQLMRAALHPDTRLDFRMESGPVHVQADRSKLHQLLVGLCQNASEAIGTNPGLICLSASAMGDPSGSGLPPRPDGWVRITVADDGKGMSDDIRRRIFDPFFTTKPVGRGSGLGLTVAAQLVDEMGGRIDVESAPGVGTTVTIDLPGAPAAEAGDAPDTQPRTRGDERLMIVDDEADVVATLRRLMQRLGYDVDAFTSPQAALEQFRRAPGRYDLVISDMVMPGMTGEQLSRACREARPDVPIILCSAYGRSEGPLDGPAPSWLDKPVDPETLAREVRRMIDTATG